MASARAPRTLQEAIIYFSDYENCHRELVAMRWPDGVVRCPSCGSDNVTYLSSVRRWKCYAKHAKPQFSLKVGTVLEDSAIAIQKWLPALWMLVNCKNGISSYELGRALGVSQKTAWFMLSRLRLAIQSKDGGKLGGEVEIDETFIGGKARNMSMARRQRMGITKGRSLAGKVAVMGVLQRHHEEGKSQIRLTTVDGLQKRHLQPEVRKHVEAGATVNSDAHFSYQGLQREYAHNVIDHAESYVNGTVHTNGMENLWSLLKRSIKGTYVSIEPFHLFRYLDEQAF